MAEYATRVAGQVRQIVDAYVILLWRRGLQGAEDLLRDFERMRREMDRSCSTGAFAPDVAAASRPRSTCTTYPYPPRAVVRADLAGIDPNEMS